MASPLVFLSTFVFMTNTASGGSSMNWWMAKNSGGLFRFASAAIGSIIPRPPVAAVIFTKLRRFNMEMSRFECVIGRVKTLSDKKIDIGIIPNNTRLIYVPGYEK